MKVIFMGTPDFSVGTLEALAEAGHEVVLAVTQPDKPKGRGGKMQYTPVKEAALARDIPVYQPKKIREPECIEELKKYNADIMVVIAFGQILPKEILQMTPYGCINVHASLLPKYRGAAPIQWAVIDGEKVSGVTTMQMNEGLDTGDMILKTEIPLDQKETGGSLHDKLAELIEANFKDLDVDKDYYDAIFTGDLGEIGNRILSELLKEKGIDIADKLYDCGMLIYEGETKCSGGSGCGCSAVVLGSCIMDRLIRGEYKRVLFVPTGALLSTVSYNEGKSVPGIAHGVILEGKES